MALNDWWGGLDGWDALQAAGSFLFILCLIPQFVRTLRLGRAEDLSVLFLILVLVGSLLLLIFALHEGLWFFATSFIGNLIVWGTVLYYRLFPRATVVAVA